jgi:PAS domain S-box-containing protein
MAATPIRILLFEDNWEDARILQELLAEQSDMPVELTHVDALAPGLVRLTDQPDSIDLVLLDLNLPDSHGMDTLDRVATLAPHLPIIILTSQDNEQFVMQALKRNAQDYLVKGYVQVYPNLLWRAIRYALERKRAHEEVRAAHAATKRLLESLPSILIGVSRAGLITHWNAVAEKTFGLRAEDVVGKPLADCPVPWEGSRVQETLSGCGAEPAHVDDVLFTRPDGRSGYLGVTIVPMSDASEGLLIFGADITERKQAELERAKLQEHLGHAHKMEMIGQFAGGIAHDFHNFLQVILGFALAIRARYQDLDDLNRDIGEIVSAAQSSADIVRQLLTISRRQSLALKAVDINPAVQDIVRLLQHFVGKRIQVAVDLAEGPLVAKLDVTSLKQMLMNLSANARDAMPDGGSLTISTVRWQVDEAFATSRQAAPGPYVRVSIQDSGTGMDPAVAARMFEPFFTTKQAGSGTGLGLAVVYGLVQQHGGFIDVDTAPGKGATFHLFFPALPTNTPIERAGEAPGAPTSKPSATAPRTSGAGNGHSKRARILVVDDNPSIRLLCERILEDRYEVVLVPTGTEALDRLRGEPFDLLLTDLKMPVMDGLTLLDRAAKLRPALKRVAMTGSLSADVEQRLQEGMFPCELIRKPFTPDLLQDVVRHTL